MAGDLASLRTIRAPHYSTTRYPGFYGENVQPTAAPAPEPEPEKQAPETGLQNIRFRFGQFNSQGGQDNGSGPYAWKGGGDEGFGQPVGAYDTVSYSNGKLYVPAGDGAYRTISKASMDNAIGGGRSQDGESGGGGGCYITTACEQNSEDPVTAAGDLQTLRQWRDEVLMKTPTGQVAVNAYYDTAPQIASDISMRPDGPEVLSGMHQKYIQPAVGAIRAGDNGKAMQIYMQMLQEAKGLAAAPDGGQAASPYLPTQNKPIGQGEM